MSSVLALLNPVRAQSRNGTQHVGSTSQRVALLVTFFLVSAINEALSSGKVTQCPAFQLSSILTSHPAKYQLPVQSGKKKSVIWLLFKFNLKEKRIFWKRISHWIAKVQSWGEDRRRWGNDSQRISLHGVSGSELLERIHCPLRWNNHQQPLDLNGRSLHLCVFDTIFVHIWM
jgi:hypothetical protein